MQLVASIPLSLLYVCKCVDAYSLLYMRANKYTYSTVYTVHTDTHAFVYIKMNEIHLVTSVCCPNSAYEYVDLSARSTKPTTTIALTRAKSTSHQTKRKIGKLLRKFCCEKMSNGEKCRVKKNTGNE